MGDTTAGYAPATHSTRPLDKALRLAALDLPVFPVDESKRPMAQFAPAGFLSATTDPNKIKTWWTTAPGAGVAVATGMDSGILVIDPDRHPGRPDGFQSLRDAGILLPPTFHYQTASGTVEGVGEHHIYADPGGARCHKPFTSVDVKAGGGYVVWHGPVPASRDEFAPAPAWAIKTAMTATAHQARTATSYTSSIDYAEWASTVGAGIPGLAYWDMLTTLQTAEDGIYDYGQPRQDIGHDELIRIVTRFVRLAVDDKAPGAATALDIARDIYTSGDYAHYGAEFDSARDWAIREVSKTPAATADLPEHDADTGEIVDEDSPPFRVVTRSELRNRPKPPWLVEGLVQGSGVIVVAGDPGIGKTYLSLDWAAHIATGKPWHGRKVARGHVLYVAAEGVEFFDDRLTAWELQNGRAVDDSDLQYVEEGFNLGDERAVDHMSNLVRRDAYSLVVLDTLSQLSNVEDENAAAQIANMMRAARKIRQARPGTSVLVVHHTNKGTGKVRGSTAIRGNADAVIVARGDEKGFSISTRATDDGKQKNAMSEKIDGFYLRSIGPAAAVARDFGDDERAAVEAVLSDGGWHTMGEFLERIGKDDKASRKRVANRLAQIGAESQGDAPRNVKYRARTQY